jgi:hypothetical protein
MFCTRVVCSPDIPKLRTVQGVGTSRPAIAALRSDDDDDDDDDDVDRSIDQPPLYARMRSGSRGGIACLFLNLGARWGVGGVSGQHHAPAACYPWERNPGTHCTGAGWAPDCSIVTILTELPGPNDDDTAPFKFIRHTTGELLCARWALSRH